MRTGDHVLHRPSGETWVVACVWPDEDRMSWVGYPEGYAVLSDCELIRAATDAEYRGMLQALAAIIGDDHRKRYAQQVLNND